MPTTFELELCLPSTLTVVRLPAGWKSETIDTLTCLSTTDGFRIASEVWYRELVLRTSETNRSDRQEISGTVHFTTDAGQTWEQQATVELRVSNRFRNRGKPLNRIYRYADRCDRHSGSEAAKRYCLLRTPAVQLGSERRKPIAFEPTTYQTVRLRNQGEETIHVVVSSTNIDTKSGEIIPFLAPPETAKGGTNRSVAFASLLGDTVTEIPLPIYFHPVYLRQGNQPEQAIPGEYVRDIAVKIWGSDATILREQRSLHLIIPNQQALLVSLLAIISSSIGFALVLRLHKQIFAGFTTKRLIVIALFSTTVFVAVMVPSTLFLNLIRAVLGPISVLLTGLINETLYYALLTALLIYISGDPENAEVTNRKLVKGSGVILLVSAVRLLLGGVTFGLFTPMAIVYTGTSVLLLETGFLCVRGRSLLAWAVVLGLCDALSVYVDFQLSILFYRLFYADWYIILRILIEGFVYTFIGVLLGGRLGRGLWRVAD